MCTLIALHRCVPGARLLIAANRDEYLDRPAEGPAIRATPTGPMLAPRDARAGGTWLALGARGLFAAVTNRPVERPDPTRRSRGLLVTDALAHDTARSAAHHASTHAPGTYNPFNLFVADEREAYVVTFEGRARILPLAPGTHVIGNADPEAPSSDKTTRLRQAAEVAARAAPEHVLDALAEICRGHAPEPLAGACVHAGHYGTRSSTLLRLGADGGGELRHAAGPPCRTPYEDLNALLLELARAGETAAGGTIARKAS